MKPNKINIVNEILCYLEEGKRFEDVFKLILTKWKLSRTTFANYWKVANEDFLKTLAERKLLYENKATELYIESVENGLMTKYDKLAILEGIILSKTKFEKVFVSNGEKVIHQIEPDVSAILKAIELHNRMTGDNEPERNEIEFTEQPLFPDIM
jgi:phenylalanine-4-hydroxylase